MLAEIRLLKNTSMQNFNAFLIGLQKHHNRENNSNYIDIIDLSFACSTP